MGLPIWATLAEKLKVNLDLFNLFIAIVSLVSTNDFGLNSIQKINFSKNFPFKCIRKKIWPWR